MSNPSTPYIFELSFQGYEIEAHGAYHRGVHNHIAPSFKVDRVRIIIGDGEFDDVVPKDINISELEDFIILNKFE